MEQTINEKTHLKSFNQVVIFTLIIIFVVRITTSFAEDHLKEVAEPFSGVPKVTINLDDLDDSGQLIYCGIDIAVFWDPDKDGKFTVVPSDAKVKRLITTKTHITLDLGPTSSYKKDVLYKLAMRTLYVPIGVKQEPIVIADFNNGNEGWVEIPGTLFMPTFFINPVENPYILHTEKWNDNRNQYNLVKNNVGEKNKIRPANVFWSGEKFMLHVETSEIVSGVAITILDEKNDKNTPYRTVLNNYEKHSTVSGGAIYKGGLWDKSMFNKWGNYVPKTLKFKMDILDANGDTLEEKTSEIVVDNTDLYYRSRREF